MPAETRQKTNGKTLIGPKNKIAFVCSGGATKAGAFHVGVALALQEIGFQFYGGIAPTGTASIPKPGPRDISTYVGSSAGSIISSYFAAGYSLDAIFNSFFPERDQNLDESVKPLSRLTYQTMFNLQGKLPKDYIHQLFEFKTLAKITKRN